MTKILTKAQYAVFVSDFQKIDKNGNGALDEDEAAQLLTLQLETTPKDSQLKAFMAKVDKNEDGKISFYEYLAMIVGGADWVVEGHAESLYNPNLDEQQLEAIAKLVGTPEMASVPTEDLCEAMCFYFTKADLNSSGTLNIPELRAVLSDKFAIPEQKVEQIMAEANVVGEEVKYEVFLSTIMGLLGSPPPPPSDPPPEGVKQWQPIPDAAEVGAPPPPPEGGPV